jgi:hypothetical protein
MKYSLTALSMAALAVAKPAFLNTGFDVQEGEPFTLEFSGCEGGCTISLQHGPDDNLLDFKPLTSMFHEPHAWPTVLLSLPSPI